MRVDKRLKGSEIVNLWGRATSTWRFRSHRHRFLSPLEPEVEGIAADIECFTNVAFPFAAIDGFNRFLA